jgi:LDH2 family malate/lactate/ureidoglycolate dehydrogenase
MSALPRTATDTPIRIPADEVRRVGEGLLQALEVEPSDAQQVADVFIQSELRGEASHGLRLFVHVLKRIELGTDRARPEISVIRDHNAVAVWDADRGLGQLVAAKAMREAIRKARMYGIGMVGVRNANSYTSAKYYPLLAAEAGMIGMTYSNSGRSLVVAEGGRTPIVGTNPYAIAVPAGRKPTFVLDMAVSVAMERVRQANELGRPIPQGWGLDVDGRDTTRPGDVIASLALLPIAGAKGFGLGLAHEILSSVLMGGHIFGEGATGFHPATSPMNVSYTLQAIDVETFMSLEEFRARVDEVLDTVSRSEPRPGVDRVYYPGEHSAEEEARRLRDGIPVTPAVMNSITEWCARLGVEPLAKPEQASQKD